MNQYIGKSRGGNTTKIHTVVDGLRNPVHFELSGGQVNDNTIAIDLLSIIDIKSANILAIKLTELMISELTSLHTIPPKSNTKEPWDFDWKLYKERHLFECFFNKVKHFRRIATRYDKLASSFYAFVYIAAIWLLSK